MENGRDESYEIRLSAVRKIAQRFPGLIDVAGHEHRGLGLWAGIYLQTKWQKESGRERLHLWHVVNANLTLVPLAYCEEYLLDPALAHDESPYVRSHPAHDVTCRAWKNYFKAQDEALSLRRSKRRSERAKGLLRMRFSVPRKFWRAHNASIAQAFWQHHDEFTASPLPKEELAFWSGWIRLLIFCEKISPPTTDLVLMPFLNAVMPPTSPLGEDWRIKDQPLFRRTFLKMVAYIGRSWLAGLSAASPA